MVVVSVVYVVVVVKVPVVVVVVVVGVDDSVEVAVDVADADWVLVAVLVAVVDRVVAAVEVALVVTVEPCGHSQALASDISARILFSPATEASHRVFDCKKPFEVQLTVGSSASHGSRTEFMRFAAALQATCPPSALNPSNRLLPEQTNESAGSPHDPRRPFKSNSCFVQWWLP